MRERTNTVFVLGLSSTAAAALIVLYSLARLHQEVAEVTAELGNLQARVSQADSNKGEKQQQVLLQQQQLDAQAAIGETEMQSILTLRSRADAGVTALVEQLHQLDSTNPSNAATIAQIQALLSAQRGGVNHQLEVIRLTRELTDEVGELERVVADKVDRVARKIEETRRIGGVAFEHQAAALEAAAVAAHRKHNLA